MVNSVSLLEVLFSRFSDIEIVCGIWIFVSMMIRVIIGD